MAKSRSYFPLVFWSGVVIMACVLGVKGCAALSGYEYSTGFRDGVVQKFSSKGLLYRTWEGELATEGYSRSESGKSGQVGGNVFAFSVDETNPEVIETLQKLPPGERVRLHYVEYLATWDATNYHVRRVERLRD